MTGVPYVDGSVVPRWGEADSDPLADIQRWKDHMMANTGYAPNRIFMPEWLLVAIQRRTMTKRGFRRWRARLRAQRRPYAGG